MEIAYHTKGVGFRIIASRIHQQNISPITQPLNRQQSFNGGLSGKLSKGSGWEWEPVMLSIRLPIREARLAFKGRDYCHCPTNTRIKDIDIFGVGSDKMGIAPGEWRQLDRSPEVMENVIRKHLQ